MPGEDENLPTPVVGTNPEGNVVSEYSTTRRHLKYDADVVEGESSKKAVSPKEFLLSIALKLASQPLNNQDPTVWGVFTAISTVARRRPQGINILFNSNEHTIGRLVDDSRFRIDSTAVSGQHCKIYRKLVPRDEENARPAFFLKDNSTNGTYLNWKKLSKGNPEAEFFHGDVISFANAPHQETAYTFVFREVCKPISSVEGNTGKRKAETIYMENKRMKGIGIGAPDGPVSLDDFRSLQRSNNELRKQLEMQVLEIDALKNENQATTTRLEREITKTKESAAQSCGNQIKELEISLHAKQEELDEIRKRSSDQAQALQDLTERLAVSTQTCAEANEIMKRQKSSITELEVQLEEEREQRREERQKVCADSKAAMEKLQADHLVEIKKLSSAAQLREGKLQEEMTKLQEREKKWCLQVDALLPKLEDAREKLVVSDNKARLLEAQVLEEQRSSSMERKIGDDLRLEIKRLNHELENEKQAAREEAWGKVSALELEIRAALRDLEMERRRLKEARERIMLRETQLRAFYSTTEEISALFSKQQEQLKAMQKTLEDEEDDDMEFDLNVATADDDRRRHPNAASSQKSVKNQDTVSSSGTTEKHRCDNKSKEVQNSREEEHGSVGPCGNGGFGSYINTELVLETQIDAVDTENCGDTMRMDEGTERQVFEDAEDTERGDSIRTGDLIASEVAGSWACSTAPSVHADNQSPRSKDEDCLVGGAQDGLAAESQSSLCSEKRIRTVEPLRGMAALDSLSSETEGCSDTDDQIGKNRRIRVVEVSDSETDGSDAVIREDEDEDDDTREDSTA